MTDALLILLLVATLVAATSLISHPMWVEEGVDPR